VRKEPLRFGERLSPDAIAIAARTRVDRAKGLWSGSASVNSDSQLLYNILGNRTCNLAVFVNAAPDYETLISRLQNIQSLEFSEFPALCTISPDVRDKGKILSVPSEEILGVPSNGTILLVEQKPVSGSLAWILGCPMLTLSQDYWTSNPII
jgi:hypothetical protein